MNNENRIGALWVKTAKTGSKFMSGNIELNGQKIDIVVFKNDKGGNEKRPDYTILKSQPRPQEVQQNIQQQNTVSDSFEDDLDGIF